MKRIVAVTSCFVMLATIFSVSSAVANTLFLQPGPGDGKDTFVWSRDVNKNYWDSQLQWTQNNGQYQWQSMGYFQFDLSGIDSSWTITSAQLELHHLIAGNAYPESTYELKEITSSWDHKEPTWNNNRPTLGSHYKTGDTLGSSSVLNPIALTTPGYQGYTFYGVTTIDLTALVSAWHAGGLINNGFAYYSVAPTRFSGQDHYIAASDFQEIASFRPSLTVNYSAVPEPATMILIGFGLIGISGLRRKLARQIK